MWMLVLGLIWAAAAMTVALVLARVIRRADERTPDGTWESFCVTHGLEGPVWRVEDSAPERGRVGA